MYNDTHFQIGEYCAIYLDLMGQKNFLAELAQCDREEAQRRVDTLSTPLLRFKEGVRKSVAEAKDAARTVIMQAPVSGRKADFLKMVDDVTAGIQQFSDTTLLYVKMKSPVSFILLLKMIEFVVFRMLDDAGSGLSLRGGIAIGSGWEVDMNCLCGQVISDAYNFESNVSNWSRITTSELFVTRLKGVCALSIAKCGCWFVELLRPLLDLMQRDIDGVWFLDYLNPAVGELYKREHFSSDWFIKRCEAGYNFINKQVELFRATADKNHQHAKLALRYDIMRGYWKSRLQAWKEGGK